MNQLVGVWQFESKVKELAAWTFNPDNTVSLAYFLDGRLTQCLAKRHWEAHGGRVTVMDGDKVLWKAKAPLNGVLEVLEKQPNGLLLPQNGLLRKIRHFDFTFRTFGFCDYTNFIKP